MSSLSRHGIKGQRWGVRRFQNKDGTRTTAGKKREKASRLKRSNEDVRDIYKSLSDRDLELLAYSKEEIKRLRETNFTDRIDGSEDSTVHRVIKRDENGTPVSYVDATQFTSDDLETGKKMVHAISLDIATRGGDEFRGKGYAVAAGKQMVRWFDRYGFKNYDHMEWFAKADNVASQKTAEKLGFKKMDYVYDWMKNDGSDGWVGYSYRHKLKHTSIGGTMYIEGNALILGDSSYLEHHGILGQKWGVRRFQDKTGRLTAAGKDRTKYIRDRAKASRGGVIDPDWKVGSNMLIGEIDRKLHEYDVRYRPDGSPVYAHAAAVMRDFLRDTGDIPSDYASLNRNMYKAKGGFIEAGGFDTVALSGINPNWGAPGTTQNCAKCTVAVELARFGAKLTAGKQLYPSSADAMSYWFDGAESNKCKLDDMQNTLNNYGPGSSGSIAGYYPNGAGGHCMHWSINNRGQFFVEDGQNGRRFTSIKEAADTYGFDLDRNFSAYRLDNATPNWDHLEEDNVIAPPADHNRKFTNDDRPGMLFDNF